MMLGTAPAAVGSQRIVMPTAGAALGALRSRAADEGWKLLRTRILQADSRTQMLAIISEHVAQHSCATVSAWFHAGDEQAGLSERIESLTCPMDGLDSGLRQELKSTAVSAIAANQLLTRNASRPGLLISAAPLPGSSDQCLLAVCDARSSGTQTLAQLLMVQAVVSEWTAVNELRTAEEGVRTVAALNELVSRIQQADDAEQACRRTADELCGFFGAATVFVGLTRAGNTDCRLAAISGEKQIDRFCEQTRLAEAVFLESLSRNTSAIYPADGDLNRHALLSHSQFAAAEDWTQLVSMPLSDEHSQRIGCILVAFHATETAADTEPDTHSDAAFQHSMAAFEAGSGKDRMSCTAVERFLRVGANGLAGCLSIVQKLADSRWLRIRVTLRRWMTVRRRQALLTGAGILAAAMCVPVTYRVNCDCELQPVERRFVAAPFAAPLEECFVQPGDTVQADQLMARLDGSEVRWELAGVQADLNRATKERNTHMSTHEFGEAEIARHEIERLQSREDLLSRRNQNLEIRSPITGVVVSGDHREAEGVPLETGESLFEIAPLDRMIVEVGIPEQDIRHVTEGMTVRIQLDAMPEQIREATIRRVHPRAELRENENIFIAEVELQNADGKMRPGMRGSVKVLTTQRLLGWTLFHKPVAHVLGWLGW